MIRRLMSFQALFERVIIRDRTVGEGPRWCMIDELRDLTSDLIGAFLACHVLLHTVFRFILVTRHSSVRQLAILLES